MIDQVIEDIKYFLENIETEFDHWYSMVLEMATTVGTKESKPRTTNCFQQHRDNVAGEDFKSYWQRSTAISVMEYFTDRSPTNFCLITVTDA